MACAPGRGKAPKIKHLCGVPTLRPDAAARTAAAAPERCVSANDARALSAKSILVIVHGGKKRASRAFVNDARDVEMKLGECGVSTEFVETTCAGDATRIARERDLSGYDAVGVMGGDGTFREAVEGLLSRGDSTKDSTPLFVFPCGTGNNYARDLGVSTVEDMVKKVKAGRVAPVDAVKVSHGADFANETISINVVTWGMARDAAETAEGMRWLGPLRYDVAGMFHILMNKKNFATIGVSKELSGAMSEEQQESNEYLMMFAQNTRCSGRGFTFTPLAQLDDGEFDVMTCLKTSPFHTKGLFDATKSGGGHVEDPNVAYVKAKRLTLSTREPERVGIDGEVTVETPVRLTAMKHAFLTFV